MWREQDLQTFYINKDRKYFRIKVECEEQVVESVLESVLKKTREVDEDRAKIERRG
jgi:hypothetical protein